jgi:hypothetical protein
MELWKRIPPKHNPKNRQAKGILKTEFEISGCLLFLYDLYSKNPEMIDIRLVMHQKRNGTLITEAINIPIMMVKQNQKIGIVFYCILLYFIGINFYKLHDTILAKAKLSAA